MMPAWRWGGFRTMRARMLSWLLLLNMVPVLLLVVIGLGYAEHELQEDIAQETQRLSLRLVRSVDQNIEQKLEAARTLARSPYIQEALAGFITAFAQAEKYSMEYQAMEDAYWPYLAYFAEKQGLSDLLLISPAGDIVFSAAQSNWYGTNIYGRDINAHALAQIFQQAIVQADSVIMLNKHADDQAAYVAAPVFSPRLNGVVVFIPDNAIFLREFQRDLGGGQLVSMYLPDKDGRFLLWPEQELTEQGSQLNRILASAYLGNPVHGELELNETDWLFSVRSLPAADGVLMVQQDTYTALTAIRELRISASLGAAILIIILILAARSVSNSVTFPLKELAEKLQRIGQGHRQLTADESRRDEIGALAREFNRMTRSLRKTQAQLVQSEKMASIGHLAAGVAHEINNPLSVVQANLNILDEYVEVYNELVSLLLQYLQHPSPTAEVNEHLLGQMRDIVSQNDMGFIYTDTNAILRDSRTGLDRVRKIIGNLQVFAELGNDTLQQVDLQQCIEHAMAQLNIPGKENITVRYDIRLSGTVRMKPEEMRKVFMAVLDNAFRACLPQGEVIIRASEQDGMVFMEFSDSGAGMDEAQLKRVFDPFYTTRAVGEGMGLGLSVAHAIVGAHGGNIRMESEPGKGTTVRIRIPI